MITETAEETFQRMANEWHQCRDNAMGLGLLHSFHALNEHGKNEDYTEATKHCLADVMPDFVAYVIDNKWSLSPNCQMRFLDNLVMFGGYKKVLTLPEGPHYLAVLAVGFSEYCLYEDAFDEPRCVDRLLSTWQGIKLPVPEKPALDMVIDILYGVGTYTLCYEPSYYPGAAVPTLKALQLPVRQPAGQEKEIPFVTLPTNLSL